MSNAPYLMKCPACGQLSHNLSQCSACSFPLTSIKIEMGEHSHDDDNLLATGETIISDSRPQALVDNNATVISDGGSQPPDANNLTVVSSDATVLNRDDSEISSSFFAPQTFDKTPMRMGEDNLPQTRQIHKSDLIGLSFGHCKVLEKIGQGGMALVYKAYHQTLDQYVVLKTLPPTMALSQELRERFIREARACARLHHQNIVQILDAGCQHGVYFYLMEFVDGVSLEELMAKEKKLALAECCRIIKDAAVGLSLAHGQGIIHRDIKASNIMITKEGTVKVADFGLACDLSATRISRSGQMMGTPQYMSPEQWDGERVDARSDLYSLGITFYYILAGELPFNSDSTISLFKKHSLEPPQPLRQRNPEVPPALEEIVNCLLAKKPGDRYADAATLVADLERFLRGDAPDVYQKKKRNTYKKLVVAIAIFLMLAAGTSLLFMRFWRSPSPGRKTSTTNVASDQKPPLNNSDNSAKPVPPQPQPQQPVAPKPGRDKVEPPQPPHEPPGKPHQQPGPSARPKPEKDKPKPQPQATNAKPKANSGNVVTATPAKKLAPLPEVQIEVPEYINSFPREIKGTLSSELPAATRLVFCCKSVQSRKLTKIPFSVNGRELLLTLVELEDGPYRTAIFAIRDSGEIEAKGKSQMRVDTTPPQIQMVTPVDGAVYYEEKSEQIEIKARAKDNSSGLAQVKLIDSRQSTMMMHRNELCYRIRLKLRPGRQYFRIVAIDKAQNQAQAKFSLILVPAGMVRIPGGTVMINDQPRPFATFYIDRIEVTRSAFDRYLETSRATPPAAWEKEKIATNWQELPITRVNYHQAVNYARFFKKRLPTEVEWVAAALWDGRRQYSYPWGDNEPNKNDELPGKLQPAGSWKLDRSPLGVLDMFANVAEWTADLDAKKMATRKGSYYSVRKKELWRYRLARVAYKQAQESQVNWLGFRCALSEE